MFSAMDQSCGLVCHYAGSLICLQHSKHHPFCDESPCSHEQTSHQNGCAGSLSNGRDVKGKPSLSFGSLTLPVIKDKLLPFCKYWLVFPKSELGREIVHFAKLKFLNFIQWNAKVASSVCVSSGVMESGITFKWHDIHMKIIKYWNFLTFESFQNCFLCPTMNFCDFFCFP